MSLINRARVTRFVRFAVFTLIAMAVVLLIPRAPGQSGAAPGSPTAGAVARDLPWRPFIDPINMHDRWYWLLIPMSFGVAVVYKAVRLQSLERYWLQVLYLTMQIVIAMILLGAATYVIVVRFAPFVAAR